MRLKGFLMVWLTATLALAGEGGSAQNVTRKGAMVRSLALPGWGQVSLGRGSAARGFMATEVGLWFSWLVSSSESGRLATVFQSYATLHAGAPVDTQPDIYYYRLGRYSSMEEYNTIMLRQRRIGDVYPEGAGLEWLWNSAANQARFEDLRSQSILMAKSANFMLGGLVVNRVVALIHVLFLTRSEATLGYESLPGGGHLRLTLPL